MNLFSLWRSTSIEIMSSKRIIGILYAAVGVLIFVDMTFAYTQFFYAHFTIHEFDVTIGDFIFITLVFFVPFWLVGAVILRATIQRLRLAFWVRGALRVVTYDTVLRPAEAGFLVDYKYEAREFVATLLDLHFREIIHLSTDSGNRVGIVPLESNASVSRYEWALFSGLQAAGTQTFQGFDDVRLVRIAKDAHEVLIQHLSDNAIIQPEWLPRRWVRIVFRLMSVMAGFTAWILVSRWMEEPMSVITILYPRYPIHISQAILLWVIAAIILAILASGFWPRFKNDYKTRGYAAWIDAAGLLLYVRAVFRHRFSHKHIASQDDASIRAYAVYAIAYGVMPSTPRAIADVLMTYES